MEQNMIPMVTPMEINEKIEEFCETIYSGSVVKTQI